MGRSTMRRSPSQQRGVRRDEEAAQQQYVPCSFFKVFFPHLSSQRLLIPNAFVRLTRLRERLPEQFILRNGRGREWMVKPSCVGNRQVYFADGWNRFVEDNTLQLADFIVFTCDGGNNIFKFKIYEVSGSQKEEVEPEIEISNVAGMETEDEEDDDDYVMDEVEEEVDDDDYDDHVDVDVDDDEEEEEDENEMRNECHHRAEKVQVKSKSGIAGSSSSKTDEDATIAAKYFQHPENPYFVAPKYKHRHNELHIPFTTINDYSLQLPRTITLYCQYIEFGSAEQAPSIRKSPWTSTEKVQIWKDGRTCIKGWSSFCRKNRIDKNETCTCEFVLREDQKVKRLQVHVVRR